MKITQKFTKFLYLLLATCLILSLPTQAKTDECELILELDESATQIQFNLPEQSADYADFLKLPNDFQSFDKSDKIAIIWKKILETEYSLDDLPDFKFGGKNLLKAAKAFFVSSTAFTHNHIFKKPYFIKFIHPVGSVGVFQFEPAAEGHPYSGILAAKTQGILRLSAGLPLKTNFIFGAAFQFFVDSESSVNIHAMPNLDGQGLNRNPFDSTISNQLAVPSSRTTKFLAQILRVASLGRDPLRIPIDEVFDINANGEAIGSPIAPGNLQFRPTKEANSLIPPDTKQDTRMDLAKIPPGTPLYSVYGVSEEGEVYMGQIRLMSRLVPSKAGDDLRFKHQDSGGWWKRLFGRKKKP